MSNPPAVPEKKPVMEKAIVAKGRAVVVKKKSFKEGEELTLPAEEVAELRARGFLVDPNTKEIPRGDGPKFESHAGPSIQAAA